MGTVPMTEREPRYGDAIIVGGIRRRVTGLYEPTAGDRRICYAVGIDVGTVPLAGAFFDSDAEAWRPDGPPHIGTPGQIGAFE